MPCEAPHDDSLAPRGAGRPLLFGANGNPKPAYEAPVGLLAVPEPATADALGAGLGLYASARRRGGRLAS